MASEWLEGRKEPVHTVGDTGRCCSKDKGWGLYKKRSWSRVEVKKRAGRTNLENRSSFANCQGKIDDAFYGCGGMFLSAANQ